MKIAQTYSHLNGLEFMLVHRHALLDEIEQVINSVDASSFMTKESKEKTKTGKLLYSPAELNKSIKDRFYSLGWHESKTYYYVSENVDVSREIALIRDKEKQKQIIESYGITPYSTYNQVDFQKDRVGLEVQFGKYFSVQYDLHVKHTFFYQLGDIDVGVEVIPTRRMMKQMSSGVPWYENELMNIVREGRSNPSMPIILLGVEP